MSLRRMSRRASAAFVLFYSALAIIDVALIVKYVRIGPQSEEPHSSGAPALPAPASAKNL